MRDGRILDRRMHDVLSIGSERSGEECDYADGIGSISHCIARFETQALRHGFHNYRHRRPVA